MSRLGNTNFLNTNLRQTNIVEAINKLVYIYNAEFGQSDIAQHTYNLTIVHHKIHFT